MTVMVALVNYSNIVLEDLTSKKRYQDAARVLLDYAHDVREAVIALVQGNHFSEAKRVVRLCHICQSAKLIYFHC